MDKLRIHLSNPAAQVLQAGVGADEDGRALLKYGVDVRPVKAGGGEVPLGTGAREVLQLGLVPSPRWPGESDGDADVTFAEMIHCSVAQAFVTPMPLLLTALTRSHLSLPCSPPPPKT